MSFSRSSSPRQPASFTRNRVTCMWDATARFKASRSRTSFFCTDTRTSPETKEHISIIPAQPMEVQTGPRPAQCFRTTAPKNNQRLTRPTKQAKCSENLAFVEILDSVSQHGQHGSQSVACHLCSNTRQSPNTDSGVRQPALSTLEARSYPQPCIQTDAMRHKIRQRMTRERRRACYSCAIKKRM